MRVVFMQCIIHVGTEKTGTTLLQKWVFDNAKKLESYGLSMSRMLGQYNHRKMASYFNDDLNDDYFIDQSIVNMTQRDMYFENFEVNFEEEINYIRAQGKTKQFLITSEHFHSRLSEIHQIRNLKSFLGNFFSSFKVIGYFREQSQLRRSLYSTAIRVGQKVSFENFHKNIETNNHYYNYYDSWSMWADVFGLENLVTRVYDKNTLLENDIRCDFLNSIDLSYDRNDLDWNLSKANEGFSHIVSLMGQSINSAMPRYKPDGSFNGDREFAIENLLQFQELNIYKLTDSQSSSIYENFQDANGKFGRKFLGFDGNPFVRPDNSTDANAQSGDYERLEAALQSFFGSYVLQLFEFARR
jgi:hypothetical protein